MHQLIEKNKDIIDKLVEKLKEYKIEGVYIKNPKNISVFSDLDLYVVCTDDVVEKLFNQREKIFTHVNKVLVVWGNKFSNNNYSLNVVFDIVPIPLKIDINIKRLNDIKPSEKLKDCEILFDSNGLLTDAKEKSKDLTYQYSVDTVELQRILNAFCGWIFNTLSKIKKGDYASVVFEHEVDYIENGILPLYFSLSEGRQEGLYEGNLRIDSSLLNKIKGLKLQQQEDSLVEDLQLIVEIYEDLAKQVVMKYSLTYPKDAVEKIMEILTKYKEY